MCSKNYLLLEDFYFILQILHFQNMPVLHTHVPLQPNTL